MSPRTTGTLVCLLLLTAGLRGQRYSFKRYDQSSGLPNQNVRTLLQDRAGFLWIGTDNALYRYDGRQYRTFSTADGLPPARVEALHQSNDGTIWVATSSGLARLDGERFEIVSSLRGMGALASDRMGRLYVNWQGPAGSRKGGGGARQPEFHRPQSRPSQASGSISIRSGPVVSCGRRLLVRWRARALAEGVPR